MSGRRESHVTLPTAAEVHIVAVLTFGAVVVSGLACIFAMVVWG
jgi:hypothetical protein